MHTHTHKHIPHTPIHAHANLKKLRTSPFLSFFKKPTLFSAIFCFSVFIAFYKSVRRCNYLINQTPPAVWQTTTCERIYMEGMGDGRMRNFYLERERNTYPRERYSIKIKVKSVKKLMAASYLFPFFDSCSWFIHVSRAFFL